MKFTREKTTAVMIRNVSDGAICIGDDSFTSAVALTSEAILGSWHDAPVAELTGDHFAVLLESEPELVVLGTGSETVFAPRELVFAFARLGVGLEVMNTPAAARTFNVLAGDGRRIAAVLYV
ncbi:MAG: Mth938-like domain-containing protein [Woeseiaceae bacterium]